MDKSSYSSIDTKTGRRIGGGWLTTRTQTLEEKIRGARQSFTGKSSRAHAFRFWTEFLQQAFADEWFGRYRSGDIRGRDKDARWGMIFWMPHIEEGQPKLHIAMIEINARNALNRKGIVGPLVLAEVTDHAVARAICRMAKEGDISYRQICDEFQEAVEQLMPLLFARIQALNEKKNISCPDLIVPTPLGALTVRVVDSPGAGVNPRRRILFTTWLSDKTMQSEPHLRAVQSARAKGSILLDNGKTGTLISPFKSEADAIRAYFSFD